MKTGNPTYLWATDLELRARLRVGTVLETHDCGYLRADAITPEGVICPGLDSPGYLWTWDALQMLECTIYSKPGDPGHEKFETPLPRLVRRGGRLDLEADGETSRASRRGGAGPTSGPPKLLRNEDLERALATALARSAPAGWERIILVLAIAWDAEPGYSIVTRAPGGEEEALAPAAEVLALASALRAEAQLLRGPLCSRIVLQVDHLGDGDYRYRIQVGYDGDPPG